MSRNDSSFGAACRTVHTTSHGSSPKAFMREVSPVAPHSPIPFQSFDDVAVARTPAALSPFSRRSMSQTESTHTQWEGSNHPRMSPPRASVVTPNGPHAQQVNDPHMRLFPPQGSNAPRGSAQELDGLADSDPRNGAHIPAHRPRSHDPSSQEASGLRSERLQQHPQKLKGAQHAPAPQTHDLQQMQSRYHQIDREEEQQPWPPMPQTSPLTSPHRLPSSASFSAGQVSPLPLPHRITHNASAATVRSAPLSEAAEVIVKTRQRGRLPGTHSAEKQAGKQGGEHSHDYLPPGAEPANSPQGSQGPAVGNNSRLLPPAAFLAASAQRPPRHHQRTHSAGCESDPEGGRSSRMGGSGGSGGREGSGQSDGDGRDAAGGSTAGSGVARMARSSSTSVGMTSSKGSRRSKSVTSFGGDVLMTPPPAGASAPAGATAAGIPKSSSKSKAASTTTPTSSSSGSSSLSYSNHGMANTGVLTGPEGERASSHRRSSSDNLTAGSGLLPPKASQPKSPGHSGKEGRREEGQVDRGKEDGRKASGSKGEKEKGKSGDGREGRDDKEGTDGRKRMEYREAQEERERSRGKEGRERSKTEDEDGKDGQEGELANEGKGGGSTSSGGSNATMKIMNFFLPGRASRTNSGSSETETGQGTPVRSRFKSASVSGATSQPPSAYTRAPSPFSRVKTGTSPDGQEKGREMQGKGGGQEIGAGGEREGKVKERDERIRKEERERYAEEEGRREREGRDGKSRGKRDKESFMDGSASNRGEGTGEVRWGIGEGAGVGRTPKQMQQGQEGRDLRFDRGSESDSGRGRFTGIVNPKALRRRAPSSQSMDMGKGGSLRNTSNDSTTLLKGILVKDSDKKGTKKEKKSVTHGRSVSFDLVSIQQFEYTAHAYDNEEGEPRSVRMASRPQRDGQRDYNQGREEDEEECPNTEELRRTGTDPILARQLAAARAAKMGGTDREAEETAQEEGREYEQRMNAQSNHRWSGNVSNGNMQGSGGSGTAQGMGAGSSGSDGSVEHERSAASAVVIGNSKGPKFLLPRSASETVGGKKPGRRGGCREELWATATAGNVAPGVMLPASLAAGGNHSGSNSSNPAHPTGPQQQLAQQQHHQYEGQHLYQPYQPPYQQQYGQPTGAGNHQSHLAGGVQGNTAGPGPQQPQQFVSEYPPAGNYCSPGDLAGSGGYLVEGGAGRGRPQGGMGVGASGVASQRHAIGVKGVAGAGAQANATPAHVEGPYGAHTVIPANVTGHHLGYVAGQVPHQSPYHPHPLPLQLPHGYHLSPASSYQGDGYLVGGHGWYGGGREGGNQTGAGAGLGREGAERGGEGRSRRMDTPGAAGAARVVPWRSLSTPQQGSGSAGSQGRLGGANGGEGGGCCGVAGWLAGCCNEVGDVDCEWQVCSDSGSSDAGSSHLSDDDAGGEVIADVSDGVVRGGGRSRQGARSHAAGSRGKVEGGEEGAGHRIIGASRFAPKPAASGGNRTHNHDDDDGEDVGNDDESDAGGSTCTESVGSVVENESEESESEEGRGRERGGGERGQVLGEGESRSPLRGVRNPASEHRTPPLPDTSKADNSLQRKHAAGNHARKVVGAGAGAGAGAAGGSSEFPLQGNISAGKKANMKAMEASSGPSRVEFFLSEEGTGRNAGGKEKDKNEAVAGGGEGGEGGEGGLSRLGKEGNDRPWNSPGRSGERREDKDGRCISDSGGRIRDGADSSGSEGKSRSSKKMSEVKGETETSKREAVGSKEERRSRLARTTAAGGGSDSSGGTNVNRLSKGKKSPLQFASSAEDMHGAGHGRSASVGEAVRGEMMSGSVDLGGVQPLLKGWARNNSERSPLSEEAWEREMMGKPGNRVTMLQRLSHRRTTSES